VEKSREFRRLAVELARLQGSEPDRQLAAPPGLRPLLGGMTHLLLHSLCRSN